MCMHHTTAKLAGTQKENALAYRVWDVRALHKCRTHRQAERKCEGGLTVHEAHGAVAVLSRIVQGLQM